MEGAAALRNVFGAAPPVPHFISQTSAGESFANIGEEADVMHENHSLRLRLQQERHGAVMACVCEDLLGILDETAINSQIQEMVLLKTHLNVLIQRMPDVQQKLRAFPAAPITAEPRVYFEQKHREKVVGLVHDMARIVAEGPEKTVEALTWYNMHRLDNALTLPGELVALMRATASRLTDDLTLLMSVLDRLDSKMG
ncbi:hypothetical protein DIPPA_62770 [Diplonema papillatum]|nr:hypothetical protein DIPPA_62770 [Diplonema papillatum]